MALDPRVKRFLDAFAAGNPARVGERSVAQRRAALAELMSLSGHEGTGTSTSDRTLELPRRELAARIVSPSDAGTAVLPGLIYFHGGGLVAGSIETHTPIARALARAAGCRIVLVEYRLAPEHRFPAAAEDAIDALLALGEDAAAFGIDKTRLGVCGDSAGGTLAAVACKAAAAAGRAPALQVLLCPILDHSGETESRRLLGAGYMLDAETLEDDLRHYLPAGADRADPRISPLRAASLDDLPRTIVHTAEFDPLRDEGRMYFDRLTRAGRGLSYTCHPGMIHLFYGLGAVIPYARTAIEQIGDEIRAAWTGVVT